MQRQDGSIHRDLRRLFSDGTLTGLDDAALLGRFIAHRDERAFEAIVARHGRMVLGVCRGILPDPHAAEDAFQATFLILARKARSIRVDGSLGRWLYGVARRVARRARTDQTRLDARKSGCLAVDEVPAPIHPEPCERIATLHEVVGRLPEKFRAPIILCYLEGHTHEEAARLLHWPLGTVKGRLARARGRLRERLTRRGFAPSAGLLGLSLAGESGIAAPFLSTQLVKVTTQAALRLAGKSFLPTTAVTSSSALVKGVLEGMILHKLKVAAVFLGLGALGAGVYAQNGHGPIGEGKSTTPAARKFAADPVLPTNAESNRRRVIATEIVDLKAEAQSLRESLKRLEIATARAETLLNRLQESAKPPGELPRLPGVTVRRRHLQERSSTPSRPTADAKPRRPTPPEYVVDPPDLVHIQVFGTLPKEGLDGNHLVGPDGRMELGPYGRVFAEGMTVDEIKERIVDRLRAYFSDEELGLRARNDERENVAFFFRDTTALSVQVSGYNSKVYYVQGQVAAPGRLPCTGNNTVLDALTYAGGVLSDQENVSIQLVRPSANPGEKANILDIDLKAIIDGDQTTNYPVLPFDRIVVRSNQKPQNAEAFKTSAATVPTGNVVLKARYAAVAPVRVEELVQVPTGEVVLKSRHGRLSSYAMADVKDEKQITIHYPVSDLVTTNENDSSEEPEFAALIEILKDTVALGTWNDPQGDNGPAQPGTITPSIPNCSISVSHSLAVHDQIVRRLRQLRRSRGLPIPEVESVPAQKKAIDPIRDSPEAMELNDQRPLDTP
jgi:RNA polymerase sigma factor (sigma-70 family)